MPSKTGLFPVIVRCYLLNKLHKANLVLAVKFVVEHFHADPNAKSWGFLYAMTVKSRFFYGTSCGADCGARDGAEVLRCSL